MEQSNGEIWEIKKSFQKSNGEILEIKKSFAKSNRQILEIKKPFEKSNGEILGNQKIIREIKRTRQESKHIIILVILFEHRRKSVFAKSRRLILQNVE